APFDIRCAYEINSHKECTSSAWSKIDQVAYVSGIGCGNGVCESAETKTSCPADCGAMNNCGDGICSKNENRCNCALDCGAPTSEVCNGLDDNCDGRVDEGIPCAEWCNGKDDDKDPNYAIDNGGCVAEFHCNDGIDEDANGYTDAADPYCCPPGRSCSG